MRCTLYTLPDPAEAPAPGSAAERAGDVAAKLASNLRSLGG